MYCTHTLINCLLNAKLKVLSNCTPTASSALGRLSANVVVIIIITPLWFNELVQLWLTHLSGLIKTV